jgi:hypothetical protein
MSTRCSFFYNHDDDSEIHVFEDLAEADGKIFVEKKQTAYTSLTLSPEELLLISQSFDLNELKRQAALSDETLLKAAQDYVSRSLSAGGFLRGLYFADFPKGEETTVEEQIDHTFKKFSNTRDKLKDLLEKISSKSKHVHKFCFGLEHIK